MAYDDEWGLGMMVVFFLILLWMLIFSAIPGK
jgi:hypothetical protein